MIWLLNIAQKLIKAIGQSHDFSSPKTATTLKLIRLTLNIRYQTYVYDLDLHPISTHQLFEFSCISFGVICSKVSNFICYSLVVVLEYINFILPIKTMR